MGMGGCWVVTFEGRGDELVVVMFGCGRLDMSMIKLGRGLGHGARGWEVDGWLDSRVEVMN